MSEFPYHNEPCAREGCGHSAEMHGRSATRQGCHDGECGCAAFVQSSENHRRARLGNHDFNKADFLEIIRHWLRQESAEDASVEVLASGEDVILDGQFDIGSLADILWQNTVKLK